MEISGRFGLIFSLLLQVADQATDVFTALLFYFEGEYVASGLTLLLVFLPGIFIFCSELLRMLNGGKTNFLKATGFLLFTPLWAIVIHFYSLFDERYLNSAMYFRAAQGFLEAGPQLTLQLALVFRGFSSEASKMVMEPILNEEQIDLLSGGNDQVQNVSTFEVFGRSYDLGDKYVFGWVHIASIVLSAVTVYITALVFNDIEEQAKIKRCKSLVGKLAIAAPFFFFTLLYRAVGLALLICFIKFWAGSVIFMLFFINVLSALYIGDDFPRSFSYGLWSLLLPVGYNRDPSAPLGYTKLSVRGHVQHNSASFEDEPNMNGGVSDLAIARSSSRSRYFLTSHITSSIIILGTSLLFTLILIQTDPKRYEFNSEAIFNLGLLNTVFLPLLALSLGLSILFVRPYHRCDCSGGETPKGNIIV